MSRTIGLAAALLLAAPLCASSLSIEELPETGESGAPARGAARQVVLPPVTPPALREPDEEWVEETLASLSLDEKIGQMIMPQWNSGSAPTNLSTYHVGGFIFLATPGTIVLDATNGLQAQADVPLLFSIDCEAGAGARISDATHFPMNMALAASGRTDLAQQQGVVTARECRAVGVHIGLGPVLDTNTQPINPIIGIRSYGDDTALIATMAEAYVAGATSAGMLTTFKHYPGHGATEGDTHEGLQTVDISCDELQARHVAPYADLLSRGIGDCVMSAHVWYPCLSPGNPNPIPATLSGPALTDVLRTQIGFDGVAMSDAFNMAGLTAVASTADAARMAVQAGLDIILMPTSVSSAFDGVKDAVVGGQISQDRIDASVRRILRLKSRVGLPEAAIVPAGDRPQTLEHPDHLALAEEIGELALARGRAEPGVLPLTDDQDVVCYVLTPNSSIFYSDAPTIFSDALLAELPGVDIHAVSATANQSTINDLLAEAAGRDRIVVASFLWRPTQPTPHVNLVNGLLALPVPVVYVSFGSPWHIAQFPTVANYYCGFSRHYSTQVAGARMLVGEVEPEADWPVDVEQLAVPQFWAVH